jgi:precorrin-6B methylase 2
MLFFWSRVQVCIQLEFFSRRVSSLGMDLTRVLHRLPDLDLRLNARHEVTFTLHGRSQPVDGPHTLRLLEVFSRPVSVAAALEVIKPHLTGTQDWLLAWRTIQQLEAMGVLVEEQAQASAAPFDQASLHIEMLNDQRRTQAFIEAIQRLVKPGDVVADLGTGTGVLAATAAKAGARRVYAIEAGAVRHQAERLFQGNGLSERVEIVPGWSTQVTLPAPVDVLVGELLGNDPFGEDVAAIFRDGVSRFLKPGGKVIPATVELWAALVSVPQAITAQYRFEPEALAVWEQNYGLKFTALQTAEAATNFTVAPQKARDWPVLSEPVRLIVSDLLSGEQTACPDALQLSVRKGGLVNGVRFYFKAQLCEGVEITTDPLAVDESGHWRNVVRLFPQSQTVEPGQMVRLDCSAGYLAARLASR